MRKVEDFTDKIKKLERNERNIKGAQFVGQDSIRSYKTSSNNNYDHTFTISEADTVRIFRLTLIHATAKTGALITLNVLTRNDNSDVMSNPIPYATNTAPAIQTRWKREVPLVGDRTTWIIRYQKNLPGINSFVAYSKFFFDGTDTGTWTIQEI